jgi:hypothetical protein
VNEGRSETNKKKNVLVLFLVVLHFSCYSLRLIPVIVVVDGAGLNADQVRNCFQIMRKAIQLLNEV